MEPTLQSKDAKIRELTGLLELMSIILRQFTHLDSDDFDVAVQIAIATIGRYTGVDRSYVFVADGDEINNTHEWCAPGIQPEIQNLQRVPIRTISWWWEPRLRRGQAVHIPSVTDLPDERSEEREILAKQGIQSLLVMPLIGPAGMLQGFIGFDSVQQKRVWDTQSRLLLRAVADMISSAMTRRHALAELQRSEARFRTLVRHSSNVVIILDADQRISYLGPTGQRLLNRGSEPDVGKPLLDLVHPEDRSLVKAALVHAALARGQPTLVAEHRLLSGRRDHVWCQATATDLSDDPVIGGILITAHDITARKAQDQALRQQALRDDLTGLPNQALLEDRLRQLLALAQRFAGRVSLMLLALHQEPRPAPGQQRAAPAAERLSAHHAILLPALAERLRQGLAPGETAARVADNRFAVLRYAEGTTTPQTLVASAEQMVDALAKPVTLGSNSYKISISAGLALADDPALWLRLLRDAETGLMQAKMQATSRGGRALILSGQTMPGDNAGTDASDAG